VLLFAEDGGRDEADLIEMFFKPINAANLREAHAKVEAGRSIGKVVLAGW
jgi:hypothetical protein